MTPEITRANACDHRSPEPIRIDKCDLCGGSKPKGTPFEVYGCDLHGECSFEKRRRKVQSCGACLDRESVEFGVERVAEEQRPVKRPKPTATENGPCQHRTPIAHVSFDRQQEPWQATVTVKCGACGLAFYVNSGTKVVMTLTSPQSAALLEPTSEQYPVIPSMSPADPPQPPVLE